MLLLDEPTNHLDIPSQEVLEAVLDDYAGTILLVTHDRYLVDALATQIWEVNPDENQMTAFNGTYSQMKDEREKEAARMAMTTSDSESRHRTRRVFPQNLKRKAQRTRMNADDLLNCRNLRTPSPHWKRIWRISAAQLESPLVSASEVVKISKEYERIQKEMDEKLAEWEGLQV